MSLTSPNNFIDSVKLIRSGSNKASESGLYDLREVASLSYIMEHFDLFGKENKTTKTLNEMNSYVTFVFNILNKATQNGLFTIDDAFLLRLSLLIISKELSKIEKQDK